MTELPPVQPPLPQFAVRLQPPDLGPWMAGNTGVAGFTTRDSGRPGPHVGVLGLTHGNEIAGAIAIEHLLRLGFAPERGRMTLGFANLAAFARFDPRQPTASRFVDEDLNRVWSPELLDGPRHSAELDRARAMRPLVEQFDMLLDLHSMLWPSDPLILSGPSAKGRELALAIGTPPLVVADRGHLTGPRLIDHPAFSGPETGQAAILVEAGQHWEEATVEVMLACIAALLRHTGLATAHPALPAAPDRELWPRFAEVTEVVTASTSGFAFLQPFRGGEIVARRNTLIAVDGTIEIRTPHDSCLLVMPSLRPSRGHTAVRLARFA